MGGARCARLAGAARITVTDLVDEPVAVARAIGADETTNISQQPDRLAAFETAADRRQSIKVHAHFWSAGRSTRRPFRDRLAAARCRVGRIICRI
jgi:threonine dehydrogenase-like Zn-dependent dehydrogenase